MGKEKEAQEPSEQHQGDPANDPRVVRDTNPDRPDMGAQVRSILSEMAKSGELLGGGGGEESGQGGSSSPPSFDLRAEIRNALAEERAKGEAERERKSVHERLERIENPPKKRQYGKPWSPFGG